MTNMAIIYVDENTARVTKAFMKKANIFGTDEFMHRHLCTTFGAKKFDSSSQNCLF